jgi:hypothetical protein
MKIIKEFSLSNENARRFFFNINTSNQSFNNLLFYLYIEKQIIIILTFSIIFIIISLVIVQLS